MIAYSPPKLSNCNAETPKQRRPRLNFEPGFFWPEFSKPGSTCRGASEVLQRSLNYLDGLDGLDGSGINKV